MNLGALLLTAIALCCFAGNSLLCRLALAENQIDATSFTAIRLVSGAAVLALFSSLSRRDARSARGSWVSAALLFAYAAPFSFAYLRLGAAMGALILFALVQATMLGWGVVRGERPSALAWSGIVLAIGGLVALTLPGRSAPDPLAAFLMAIAGVAWGVYSLRGRVASGSPLALTAASFVRSLPFAALLVVVTIPLFGAHATARGIFLAATSGAIASGLGYSVWYAVLPQLSRTRAAVVQLLTPVVAASGAVVWLGESVSARLVLAGTAILGGVALTLRGPSR